MKSEARAMKGEGWKRGRVFSNLPIVVVLGILCAQIAVAQSFTVQNPKKLAWPQADAEKIYKFATRVVEDEFKPRQAVHPQFTVVLGYEKDQMDVNSNELRLSKWDRRLFTEGVILFSFEQLMSTATKTRLVQRALKESDAVVTVDQARKSSCRPTFLGTDCVESAPSKP